MIDWWLESEHSDTCNAVTIAIADQLTERMIDFMTLSPEEVVAKCILGVHKRRGDK